MRCGSPQTDITEAETALAILEMLRSRFVRNYLLGTLSVLGGMGIAWIFVLNSGWSEGTQEFWFLIIAALISIPLNKLFHLILEKLIGKPEV